MAQLYFQFFSGVFAGYGMTTFDQPVVATTLFVCSAGLYLVAWRLSK